MLNANPKLERSHPWTFRSWNTVTPPGAQLSQIQLSSRGRRHLADASRLISCPTDPIECEAPLKKPKEPSATRDQPVSPVPVPWAG